MTAQKINKKTVEEIWQKLERQRRNERPTPAITELRVQFADDGQIVAHMDAENDEMTYRFFASIEQEVEA